jgi:hypothetical protein
MKTFYKDASVLSASDGLQEKWDVEKIRDNISSFTWTIVYCDIQKSYIEIGLVQAPVAEPFLQEFANLVSKWQRLGRMTDGGAGGINLFHWLVNFQAPLW